MDFAKLQKHALKLKEQVEKSSKDAIKFSTSKLADSKFTLKNIQELEDAIIASKNTKGTDSQTGRPKTFVKRSVVIFCDTQATFFKEMLYKLPILQTKAFSQSLYLRLADAHMKDLDLKAYKVGKIPSLVVFENTKIYKVLAGEEEIQKVVKSLSLDINSTIDSL